MNADSGKSFRFRRAHSRIQVAVAGVVLTLAASSANAAPAQPYTDTIAGHYRVLLGVSYSEADEVHEDTAAEGWSPIHVDIFNNFGHVILSSIWVKDDGVPREIFWHMHPLSVQARMNSDATLNKLLQVDACTVDYSYLGYINAFPGLNVIYETMCAGIWTDQVDAERGFVYLPEYVNAVNTYWDPDASIFDAYGGLENDGFELISRSQVRPFSHEELNTSKPWWQFFPSFQDGVHSDPANSAPAYVALYRKTATVPKYERDLTPGAAEDSVNTAISIGEKPISINSYSVHETDNTIFSGEPNVYSIVTVEDDRDHLVAWDCTASSAENWIQFLYTMQSMRPLTLCASQDTQGYLQYSIVFRDISVRVNRDVGGTADDDIQLPKPDHRD